MRLTFIETPSFRASAKGVLSDDELRAVEDTLLENPNAGATVAGTGGARKIRVALPERGKSGGARVIYFHHAECERVYFLLAYAKNEADDLSDTGKKLLRGILERIKREACQ